MAKVKERDTADQAASGYPKKYWWLVLVIVPLILAAIQFQPWRPSSSSEAGRSVAAHEIGTAVLGDVSVVVNEAASAGTTLDPALRQMIEEAVKLGRQGQHDAAIARIEKVRQSSAGVASLPSLLTGLGAEYAAAGRTEQARQSFEQVLEKDPTNQMAWKGLALLPDGPLKAVRVVNFSSYSGWHPSNLVDGDPATLWSAGDATFPQSIVIEFPVECDIKELSFNNPASEQATKDLEISISTQSPTAGFTVVGKTTLARGEIGQGVPIAGTPSAKWLKIRVLSNYGHAYHTYLGEVVITGRPHVR